MQIELQIDPEKWVPVKGYENYLISTFGNVLNTNKLLLLTPIYTSFGYKSVNLSRQNNKKRFLIHRLVALNFIPLVPGKDLVNHIDGIKTNNHISNLEWCNSKENATHYQKVISKNKYIYKYRIAFIKDNISTMSMTDIAKELGYNKSSAVDKVCKRNNIKKDDPRW